LFTSVRHNILLDILGHNSSNVPIKTDVEQISFYTNISSSLIDSKLIMRKKKVFVQIISLIGTKLFGNSLKY